MGNKSSVHSKVIRDTRSHWWKLMERLWDLICYSETKQNKIEKGPTEPSNVMQTLWKIFSNVSGIFHRVRDTSHLIDGFISWCRGGISCVFFTSVSQFDAILGSRWKESIIMMLWFITQLLKCGINKINTLWQFNIWVINCQWQTLKHSVQF